MALERLIQRYQEALAYWESPASAASRLFVPDQYRFCAAYVRDQYSDHSKQWEAEAHRTAFLRARGPRDVSALDVSEV